MINHQLKCPVTECDCDSFSCRSGCEIKITDKYGYANSYLEDVYNGSIDYYNFYRATIISVVKDK